MKKYFLAKLLIIFTSLYSVYAVGETRITAETSADGTAILKMQTSFTPMVSEQTKSNFWAQYSRSSISDVGSYRMVQFFGTDSIYSDYTYSFMCRVYDSSPLYEAAKAAVRNHTNGNKITITKKLTSSNCDSIEMEYSTNHISDVMPNLSNSFMAKRSNMAYENGQYFYTYVLAGQPANTYAGILEVTRTDTEVQVKGGSTYNPDVFLCVIREGDELYDDAVNIADALKPGQGQGIYAGYTDYEDGVNSCNRIGIVTKQFQY